MRNSRDLIRAVLLAAALALPAGASAQTAQFRGSAAHLGVYPGPGVPAFGGLQWRLQTGGPIRSSPTVLGDALYLGSSDGELYRVNALTGAVAWRRSLGSAVTSTPAVTASRVYVGTYDGVMHARADGDGREVWSFKTGAPLPLVWGFESGETWTSSPALTGTTLVFGARDGKLYALDAASGRLRWSTSLGARVYSTPAVEGGAVFVGTQDGKVHAVDLASGKPRWQFSTEGSRLESKNFGFDRTTVQSSPAVSGGVVYVGARDGWHYALDAATGAERWRVDHKVSWVNTSPAVSEGVVYVGSSDGHFVQAVEAATGAERWRFSTTGIVWSSPALAGEHLYIGEGNGTLYALDRQTGKEAWRYRVGGRILSSPVVLGGRVYFGSDDGGVYAVNAGAGAPLRRAVFWDSALASVPLTVDRPLLRDYLKNRGYELLDASALQRFLADRIQDQAPSVVVFALSYLPPSVAPVAADTVLFRRYLNAGGKVVWLGSPPLLSTPTTKSLLEIDRGGAARLLGVRFGRGNFDPVGARPTELGTRLGLPEWFLENWSADPEDVSSVLAYDEQGQAAAWIKEFGGPPGTGFVRFFAGDGAAGRPQLLVTVQAIAELRPR